MAVNDMTINLWEIPGLNPLVTNDAGFVIRDVMKAALAPPSKWRWRRFTQLIPQWMIAKTVFSHLNFIPSHRLLRFFLSSHRRAANWIKSLLRRRRATLDFWWFFLGNQDHLIIVSSANDGIIKSSFFLFAFRRQHEDSVRDKSTALK